MAGWSARKVNLFCPDAEIQADSRNFRREMAMTTKLLVNNFGPKGVRTIADGDELYWVGVDVCSVLGYENASDAMTTHCVGVSKRYTFNGGRGPREVRAIGESDLYRLIARSRLPEAVKLELWVFEEVLPSIRKHGGYLTAEKVEEVLNDPDTILRLATALKDERQKRLEAEVAN